MLLRTTRRRYWRSLDSIGAAGPVARGLHAPPSAAVHEPHSPPCTTTRDRNGDADFSVMTSTLFGGVSADIGPSVDRKRGRSGRDECATTWSRKSCYARMTVRIELELWTPGREPELILYCLDCDHICMRFVSDYACFGF